MNSRFFITSILFPQKRASLARLSFPQKRESRKLLNSWILTLLGMLFILLTPPIFAKSIETWCPTPDEINITSIPNAKLISFTADVNGIYYFGYGKPHKKPKKFLFVEIQKPTKEQIQKGEKVPLQLNCFYQNGDDKIPLSAGTFEHQRIKTAHFKSTPNDTQCKSEKGPGDCIINLTLFPENSIN